MTDRQTRDGGPVWVRYADNAPQSVGIYEWRVPSKAIDGLTIVFSAHMRERSAGDINCISPAFDYWDGYRVTVPPMTQWREMDSPPDIKPYDYKLLVVEGVENLPCPFCHKTPKWRAIQKSGRGVMVGGKPHEFNTWWLECCRFATTPHVADPRKLSEQRNTMLSARQGQGGDDNEG